MGIDRSLETAAMELAAELGHWRRLEEHGRGTIWRQNSHIMHLKAKVARLEATVRAMELEREQLFEEHPECARLVGI